MAAHEQTFVPIDDKSQSDDASSVSESFIDQTDLNVLIQRWLDGLEVLHREPMDPKPPQPFKAVPMESQEMTAILSRLKTLLQPPHGPVHSCARAGGTHIAVLARSLAAYLHVSLGQRDADQLLQKVSEQTTKWICSLFRFDPSALASLCHDSVRDGVRKVVQIALHRNCEQLLEDGYPTLYTNPPVVYVGATGPVGMLQNVIVQLGLPKGTLRIVPCNSVFGSLHAMDMSALEQCLVEDRSEGRMPLLIVASAGTEIAGHIDNIPRMKELSDQYKMWLHVQGDILSSLCLPESVPELNAVKEADSVCLNLGLWFGMLSVPYVTLYRKTLFPVPLPPELKNPEVSSDGFDKKDEKGEVEPDPQPKPTKPSRLFISPLFWSAIRADGVDRMLPLILWISMQYLGEQNLMDTVTYSRSMTQCMLFQLGKIEGAKRMCLSSYWSPIVLFKYTGGGRISSPPLYQRTAASEPHLEPDKGEEGSPSRTGSEKMMDVPELPQQTADGFTQSIIKLIPSTAAKVGIQLVSLPKIGVCCRFSPMEASSEQGTSVEDVTGFGKSLETAMRTVHTVALSRVVFEKGVSSHPLLRYLNFPTSLSVGFVQCLPKSLSNNSELTLDEVKDVNRLNYDLSRTLVSHDEDAFACYQHGNFACIHVKAVPPGKTVHQLMLALYEAVDELENGMQRMENMTSLLVKGIKEAEKELVQQKLKKQEEEGVLRNVPLVGSLVGWFYPTASSPAEVGRTFDLQEGTINTTTKVLEHNMQVNLSVAPDSATLGSGISTSNPQDKSTLELESEKA